MENEQRNELEAELRTLHSQLDASSSYCGDWNLSKIVESLIDACVTSEDTALKTWGENAKEKLSEKIAKRVEIRNRINEIEEELEELEQLEELESQTELVIEEADEVVDEVVPEQEEEVTE